MIGRIVEVADDHRHLSMHRGFLLVESTGTERATLGKVPLDDITAVIAHAHGVSYTNNLLVALAERGCPFVLCGANHNAVGMLLPVQGNFEQGRRFDAQIAATLPTRKRLWAMVVRAKLAQQAAVLAAANAPSAPLSALVAKVKSGDPDNLEAQGARRYWGLLLGEAFRRDQDGDGLNGLLNYGYTVLRACTARAVIAAGLHPGIGLHHSHDGNAMRLVDDLMEPFRPHIDHTVWCLQRGGQTSVDPSTKRTLVKAMYRDLATRAGNTPVLVCVQRLAISLAQVLLGERRDLDLPPSGLAIPDTDG